MNLTFKALKHIVPIPWGFLRVYQSIANKGFPGCGRNTQTDGTETDDVD